MSNSIVLFSTSNLIPELLLNGPELNSHIIDTSVNRSKLKAQGLNIAT